MAWSPRILRFLVPAFAGLALVSATVAARPHGRPRPKPPTPAPAPAPAPTPEPPAPAQAAPTPAPPPTPTPEAKPVDTSAAVTDAAQATEGADVDSLRQEYLKLRDELFASRARAAAVASALYTTKITVRLGYGTSRFYTVRRAGVRLDGASVFDDTEGKIATDDAVRFEGYIAPGRHVLAFHVEAAGKDDDRFVSTIETSAVVVATAGKDLLVVGSVGDGGDIPYAWKRKEAGSYKLHVDIDAKSVARAAEASHAAGK
jgi:hypothetical protein